MHKLILATNNEHKLSEIREMLPEHFDIASLADLRLSQAIPETSDTIEGNAVQKANFIFAQTNQPTIADDSALEIKALGGDPGVYSARYAGEHCSDEDNMQKVLSQLIGEDNRQARFRTVIAYVDGEQTRLFEGVIEGVITREKMGKNGFGYDPIFRPEGMNKTFAQISSASKNEMSHRRRALNKLHQFLISR